MVAKRGRKRAAPTKRQRKVKCHPSCPVSTITNPCSTNGRVGRAKCARRPGIESHSAQIAKLNAETARISAETTLSSADFPSRSSTTTTGKIPDEVLHISIGFHGVEKAMMANVFTGKFNPKNLYSRHEDRAQEQGLPR